jgi:hypothetical protein
VYAAAHVAEARIAFLGREIADAQHRAMRVPVGDERLDDGARAIDAVGAVEALSSKYW